MSKMNQDPKPVQSPRYSWPKYVLAAVVLGILVSVLWVAKEVARTRQIQRIPAGENQDR